MNVAIIMAGGQGSRFGEQKQFIEFNGKKLWEHAYDKIAAILPKENIVVVGVDVPGGKTRSHSVINGLNYFKDANRVIIIEAARPLVTTEQIQLMLNDSASSSTFVMPLVNTPVRRDGTYIERGDYYDLLTPQAFDYKLLKQAYDSKDEWDMTDETRLMFEFHGIKPHFLEGGQNLIKVTYAKDLPILKQLAEEYK
jgi:2-C-methyl-D-erythritol 4-phosphate cytidylyltransferase